MPASPDPAITPVADVDSTRSGRTARGVLVSGASTGIGAAVARRFAAGGDRVAVHYRGNREAAMATLSTLDGAGHALVSGDLGDPAGAADIMRQAVSALGSVDVLVCSAGIGPTAANRHTPGDVDYQSWTDVFKTMMDVNLLGPANLSWQLASHLIGRGAPGAIVNVGSRGALRGEPDHPAYAASKAALHALGQSLAVALAPHRIQVATVAPGFIATERQQAKLAGAEGAGISAQSPFGRVGLPDEVAAAVHWLASPEATWSSGAVLDSNGASYLHP